MKFEYKYIMIIIWSALVLSLFVIPISADLGSFKQNDCINIITVLNSSFVNISVLTSPTPNSTILLQNVQMTKLGSSFNYTFCNTSKLGTYTYGYIDDVGYPYSNSFSITSTGYKADTSQSIVMLIGLIIMFVISILLFLFGVNNQNLIVKIFTIGLSVLLIVFTIGYGLNILNAVTGEFTSLTGNFDSLYFLAIVLASVGMAGLILWLVAFSLNYWWKYRGFKD